MRTLFSLGADYTQKERNILTWNINGIKNKFKCEELVKLIKNFDIIILMGTQLSTRGKCPPGFLLKARSHKIDSKIPRGDVAIYKIISCPISIESVYNG